MSCERKDCDHAINMSLPKDSRFIRLGKEIIGIVTNHGSFDYTPEGQIFIGGFQEEDKRKKKPKRKIL